MKRAVFLDRDGTIIEDTGYLRDPSDVRLLPNAAEGLKEIRARGYSIFVVSNQSGVGRGIITPEQFRSVHQRFLELLKAAGAQVDDCFYCLHRPDEGCACRKPKSGMIPSSLPIRLADSYTCGDKPADVALADSLGATGILVLTGNGETSRREMMAAGKKTVLTCADLLALARLLPKA